MRVRITSARAYFPALRLAKIGRGFEQNQSNVKVYDQKRTVDYADYKVRLFYISPFDLFVQGALVIRKLEKKKSWSRSE